MVGTNFTVDFAAARQDLDALLQLIGPTWPTRLPGPLVEGLVGALDTQNRTRAIDYINLLNGLGAPGGFGGYFRRLCDSTGTVVTQFHLLRVGADGSSSDVVVHEATESSTTIALLAPEAPGYHITETEEGPSRVEFSYPNIITNADQGAVYSWKRLTYCDQDSDHGVRSYRHSGPCDAAHEHHLTTLAGGAIAADVVWMPSSSQYDPPVRPVLQLEDGSFAGVADSSTAGRAMLVFDGAGQIKWRLPGYSPMMTTPGGVIAAADAGYQAFDATGTAIGQIAAVPRDSWIKQSYIRDVGGIARVAAPIVHWGASYASLPEGNPSNNGTAVGITPPAQGRMPVVALRIWGDTCRLDDSDPLTPLGGGALLQYLNLKNELLNGGRITTTPSECSTFCDESRFRQPYFKQLHGAVSNQTPYDGPQAHISQLKAGLLIAAGYSNPNAVSIYAKSPVCQAFLGHAQAVSQVMAPAGGPVTSVYFDPASLLLPASLRITQATLLHEAMHNLTRFTDFLTIPQRVGVEEPYHLKRFVGIVETIPGKDPDLYGTAQLSEAKRSRWCQCK